MAPGHYLHEFLGARAYFTHYVLHDWPDEESRNIFRNLVTVVSPGYSKILLNESVLPDMCCPSYSAAGDNNMMSVLAGKERSRGEWVGLSHSVGLKMIRIWDSLDSGNDEAVIEAMLKG